MGPVAHEVEDDRTVGCRAHHGEGSGVTAPAGPPRSQGQGRRRREAEEREEGDRRREVVAGGRLGVGEGGQVTGCALGDVAADAGGMDAVDHRRRVDPVDRRRAVRAVEGQHGRRGDREPLDVIGDDEDREATEPTAQESPGRGVRAGEQVAVDDHEQQRTRRRCVAVRSRR